MSVVSREPKPALLNASTSAATRADDWPLCSPK
jgi:hypothetical protein